MWYLQFQQVRAKPKLSIDMKAPSDQAALARGPIAREPFLFGKAASSSGGFHSRPSAGHAQTRKPLAWARGKRINEEELGNRRNRAGLETANDVGGSRASAEGVIELIEASREID